MTLKSTPLFLLLLAGFSSFCQSTFADLITITFSGTVTSIFDNDNTLSGRVSSGVDFTGRYTYDDTASDENTNPAAGLYAYNTFALDIDLLSLNSNNVTGPGDPLINILNDSNGIDLYITTFANSNGRTFQFNDLLFNQGFFSLGSSDTTLLADDSLQPPFAIGDADEANAFRLGGTDAATQTTSFVIVGSLNSISAVPEPSSGLCIICSALVLAGFRYRASLDNKAVNRSTHSRGN